MEESLSAARVSEPNFGLTCSFSADVQSSDVIYHGTNRYIDHYSTTFDHLVPPDDDEPEVIIIFICETEYDNASYAQARYPGVVDPLDYVPHQKRVFAFPQCCLHSCGANAGASINQEVRDREIERRECIRRYRKADDEWRQSGFNDTPPHLHACSSGHFADPRR